MEGVGQLYAGLHALVQSSDSFVRFDGVSTGPDPHRRCGSGARTGVDHTGRIRTAYPQLRGRTPTHTLTGSLFTASRSAATVEVLPGGPQSPDRVRTRAEERGMP